MLKTTVLKDWLDSFGVAAPTIIGTSLTVTCPIAIGLITPRLMELRQ
ncbi:MAG: hypothetical protein ACFB4J_17850 [Elainellaceae cyanobacterium]